MKMHSGLTLVGFLVLCVVLALVLCFLLLPALQRAGDVGLKKYIIITWLPFPSNSHIVGEIVTVYSKPRTVQIIHRPNISSDLQIASPGWNISDAETENIESNLAVEISKVVLEGSSVYNSNERVEIQLSNTKTTEIPTGAIVEALEKDIKNNATGLKTLLRDYIEDGYKLDVVTTTLSANIGFRVVDPNGQEVTIDPEAIKKLNSKFYMGFKQESGTNNVITGSDFILCIFYDPLMIARILKRMQQ